MSTNRELLELAAKAAGIDISSATFDGWGYIIQSKWNPLKNDGDALRLAAKLCIDVSHNEDAGCVYADESMETWARHNGDRFAATRLAIVRAAAEVGRKMK